MTTERNAQGVDVLAPCPCCGSANVAAYLDGEPGWTTRVCCHECDCASGYSPTMAEAVAAWNKRPHGAAVAELVAAARYFAETYSGKKSDRLRAALAKFSTEGQ